VTTVAPTAASNAIARYVSKPIVETSSGLVTSRLTAIELSHGRYPSRVQITDNAAPVPASVIMSRIPTDTTGAPVNTISPASNSTWSGDVAVFAWCPGSNAHCRCCANVRA
jgi:hypothetical protein